MTAGQSLKEQWSRLSHSTHVQEGHISSLQSHLVASSGEFVGTFFFLWMSYSAQLVVLDQASAKSLSGGTSSETVVYISLVYGFSLLVNAWAFYRISGGLFNPAVRPCLFSPRPNVIFQLCYDFQARQVSTRDFGKQHG